MTERRKLPKTASHVMLYLALGVYFASAVLGAGFVVWCAAGGDAVTAAQALAALFGYTGVCGSSVVVVYTAKASKENERKLENAKYALRLGMAKQVFRETADGKLDERSVALLRSLLYENGGTDTDSPAAANNITEEVG